MSHHLDTPLARQNGQLYIDDLYVFPGHHSTVFVMDVNSTITGPDVQHGFHPEARYEFKIHFDGGEFEGLTYRVSFGEAESTGRQGLQLHALTGDDARDDNATGTLVLDGQTGASAGMNDTRLWAGRIRDPFYIDLAQLETVNAAVKNGTRHRPIGVARRGRPEQLRRHHSGVDRHRGLPPASTATRRSKHWCLVCHQARHGRRRVAADQPGRPPHDVAHLLARRHRLQQPRQRPSPIRRSQRRRQIHRRHGHQRRRRKRYVRRRTRVRSDGRPDIVPGHALVRGGDTGDVRISPGSTVGRWPTTHPK